MTNIIFSERESLQDHCGIVAAFASRDITFFTEGLKGLHIIQTRGYDGAGFWAHTTNGTAYEHKDRGMVSEVFSPAVVGKYAQTKARIWVYQVRYGTFGAFNKTNVQPITSIHKKSGERFVVAHNGQFSQTKEDNPDKSDTVLFVEELVASSQKTWEARLIELLGKRRGAWSLVVGTRDALYLARDSFGFRPLVYGHLYDRNTNSLVWVAASETSSLEELGITDYFEVLPGTIAKITENGLEVLAKGVSTTKALCIFENVYIDHGGSKAHIPRANTRLINRSPTVDEVRRRSGRILAREAPITREEVDMVIGVPGTGIEGGMTYARSLELPYFQAITDKAHWLTEQRTFMTAKIDKIYQKVLDHFRFDEQALKGRRVVLVDDSIVRGNITKGLVYLLKKQYGVTDVHIRVLSPAIDKVCHLGVNTRRTDELIASQFSGNVEKIRAVVGAESLAYLSSEGLREAMTGNPFAKGFCMGCMAGEQYPIDRFGKQLVQPRRKFRSNVAHIRLKKRHDFWLSQTVQN